MSSSQQQILRIRKFKKKRKKTVYISKFLNKNLKELLRKFKQHVIFINMKYEITYHRIFSSKNRRQTDENEIDYFNFSTKLHGLYERSVGANKTNRQSTGWTLLVRF